MHLPHSIQCRIMAIASSFLPLLSKRMLRRRFIFPYGADEQVAAQDPHAIHFLISGSASHTASYRDLSALSIFIAELGDMP